MDKRNLTDGGNACSPSIAGIEAARPLSLMMGPFQDPICVRSRHGPTLPASETAGDVTRRGRRAAIGGDDELAPFRVESGCWLRGNRVLERPPQPADAVDSFQFCGSGQPRGAELVAGRQTPGC